MHWRRRRSARCNPDSSSVPSVSSRSPNHADLSVDDKSKPSSALSSVKNPSIHNQLDDADDQDDVFKPLSGNSEKGTVRV